MGKGKDKTGRQKKKKEEKEEVQFYKIVPPQCLQTHLSFITYVS